MMNSQKVRKEVQTTTRIKKLVIQPESSLCFASYEVTAEAIEGKKKTPIRIEVQFVEEAQYDGVNKIRYVHAFVDTTQPVEVDNRWLPSFEEVSFPKVQQLVQRIWERFSTGM
jgi:hypothetical protein